MSVVAVEYKDSVQKGSWNKNACLLPDTSTQSSWTARTFSLFLPEGYPDSVPLDYLPYQFWDSIQALCSYVRGILTSEAILSGAGYHESKV
jgi:Vitamin B6 photo-protection and homoeostasis